MQRYRYWTTGKRGLQKAMMAGGGAQVLLHMCHAIIFRFNEAEQNNRERYCYLDREMSRSFN